MKIVDSSINDSSDYEININKKYLKNFNSNTDNNDEWLTPQEIIESLGTFDMDPCSPVNRPWDTAKNHYTILDDGLSKEWHGRIWMNPPYGRDTFKWMAKLAEHKNGIALIFARTETIGFHQEIWNKANSIFFFKGRLRFYRVTGEIGGTANAPSCLVSYSEYDSNAIKNSRLNGKLVYL